VEGIVSAGIRGNWANEGKVLVMLDGLELNESSYSTIHLSSRMDMDQIDRIEIIRGPGSAIYGRYAELGVINIITSEPQRTGSMRVSASYGMFADGYSRRMLGVRAGMRDSSMSLAVGLHAGAANLSANPYIDPNGERISDAVRYAPFSLTLNASSGAFSTRMFFEQFGIRQRDAFGTIIPAVANDFNMVVATADYDLHLTDDLAVTPHLTYKREQPWNKENPLAASLKLYYATVVERIAGGLVVHYDTTSRLNLLLGIEAYQERSNSPADSAFGVWKNPAAGSILFRNVALYGQLYSQNDVANLTLGARYESNDRFGESFAPRIALTKAIDDFHAKVLVAMAFRVPGIENYRTNAAIKSEKTTTYEIELGYEFSPNLAVRLNGFDIHVLDPIIYFRTTSTGFGAYQNGEESGTYGVEAELRYRNTGGHATINYSYYRASIQALDNAPVDASGRIVDEAQMLGLAPHKISFFTSLNMAQCLTTSASITYLSSRYGYDPSLMLVRFDPSLLLNLYVAYNDLFDGRGTIGVGLYNALDSEYSFIQPYNGGHPPLPAPSREVCVKVEYRL
jgi:outer membrane cobalamin receptor